MAGMCTTWGREVAVLEAQWGAIAATPLIWAAKRLNSPVTKQWELLGGNEQAANICRCCRGPWFSLLGGPAALAAALAEQLANST